jgi:hypothetical protein
VREWRGGFVLGMYCLGLVDFLGCCEGAALYLYVGVAMLARCLPVIDWYFFSLDGRFGAYAYIYPGDCGQVCFVGRCPVSKESLSKYYRRGIVLRAGSPANVNVR